MKKIQLMIILAGTAVFTMYSCSKGETKGCTDGLACNFNPDADVDNGTCTYEQTWMQDLNGDGLGNPFATIVDCNQPSGYVLNPCAVNTYYADADGDGLGDPNVYVNSCDSVDGYVSNSDDLIDVAVLPRQRATMTYVGATWCGPCGANGDPTKEHIETTFGDDVVILNVQSGDAISASGAFGPNFGSEFQTFVGSTGIPHCYWSAANHTMTHDGYYSSQPYNNSEADSHVNACLGSTLEVGVAAEATIDGSVVSVNTMAEFYAAAGQHYIGVYLLEDGVMASQQSSIAATAVTSHENVIRAAANSSNSLGNETMGTSFTANQTVSGNYTITVPSSVVNSANLQVAVVIYKANQADGISNAVIVDVN